MAKAYVDIPALELMDVDLPGVAGGGMSGWNVQQKPGTSRGLSKLSRNGEGSTYKSQCDEVVLCLRVGRMVSSDNQDRPSDNQDGKALGVD
jgi:hypothetical protein